MFRSFGRNWFEYARGEDTYKLYDRSLSGNERNELYRNDGGTFTRVGLVNGAGNKLDGRSFVPADFDRDGDLDLFVVNDDQPAVYLENRVGARRHWSVVQLEGTTSNRFGVGARVRLSAGGRTQVREIHVGSGYLGTPPPEAHFGLGDADSIERIEVRWPTGERQVLEDLEPDRIVVVREGGGSRYVVPGVVE